MKLELEGYSWSLLLELEAVAYIILYVFGRVVGGGAYKCTFT